MGKKGKPRRGNGEGSIYYHKSKKLWVGQYTSNSGAKFLYARTRLEVVEKLQKKLVSITEGKHVDKSKLTISNILDIILDEEEKANKITENSLVRKRATADKIKQMYISTLPIQRVNAVQISECLLDLKDLSNSYIRKVHLLLSNVFNRAMLLKILDDNPFSYKNNIIKPRSNKQDRKVDALTEEEEKKFREQLKNNNDLYKDIYYVLLETGMRCGECLALRRSDIDFKRNIIHVQRSLTRNRKR